MGEKKKKKKKKKTLGLNPRFFFFISLVYLAALKRTHFDVQYNFISLFRTGVLCDSLGSFRDGVFGQLPWQKKSYSSLDLPRSDGRSFVVVGELTSFSSNPLEQIVHERVHDAHGLGGNTSVRMNLFKHFVDVDGIRLLPLSFLFLLIAFGNCLSPM